MQVEMYQGSADELLRWLCSADVMMRYSEHVVAELEHIADTELIAYVKKLRVLAERLCTEGYDALLQEDPAVLDSLLTDVFSVATYESWDHPLHVLGQQQLNDLPSPGLLGYDQATQGAQLYVLGTKELALARCREAGEDAS